MAGIVSGATEAPLITHMSMIIAVGVGYSALLSLWRSRATASTFPQKALDFLFVDEGTVSTLLTTMSGTSVQVLESSSMIAIDRFTFIGVLLGVMAYRTRIPSEKPRQRPN
jgi:hypothetical protein